MDKITHCEKCGKELTYKTKKPLWCKDCNPYKDVIIYKGFGNKLPQKSQIEFNIQGWLPMITSRPFIIGGYFSWLPSPKGYPMQLDILVYGQDKKSFAIEIDGIQHYDKQFFQSDEEFETLKSHDQLKEELLAEADIPLIRITECCSKDHLLQLLIKQGVEL